jgi:RNA polymerase sigma factor (sigma-70 family)
MRPPRFSPKIDFSLAGVSGPGTVSAAMPPIDADALRWFAEELQPHEPMLRSWLRSRVPAEFDLDDIVQEAFVRVLRARETGEVRSPKAFLFATARNIALMQVRHRNVERAESLAEIDESSILDETADVRDSVARSQEIELLTKAIQSLPKKCRRIVTLRRIYGLSQKETAAELGIAERTVEHQTAIGLHKIGKFFARHGHAVRAS